MANRITWRGSDEKERLRTDIINGLVTKEMSYLDVYRMHNGLYHKFDLDLFQKYHQNLVAAVNKQSNAPGYWAKSFEKAMLLSEIEEDIVKPSMSPLEVYNMHGCYQKINFSNFKRNLARMRNTVKKEKDRAARDNEIYNQMISGRHGDLSKNWKTSKARELAVDAIKSAYAEGKEVKARHVYVEHRECQEFSNLKKFRDNFNKEKIKLLSRPSLYWQIHSDKK